MPRCLKQIHTTNTDIVFIWTATKCFTQWEVGIGYDNIWNALNAAATVWMFSAIEYKMIIKPWIFTAIWQKKCSHFCKTQLTEREHLFIQFDEKWCSSNHSHNEWQRFEEGPIIVDNLSEIQNEIDWNAYSNSWVNEGEISFSTDFSHVSKSALHLAMVWSEEVGLKVFFICCLSNTMLNRWINCKKAMHVFCWASS